VGAGAATRHLPPALAAPQAAGTGGCTLANGIQHVIYIQFDNVHFARTNPNVPSDLEQMPHLLNFLENNGTLLTNHHTPLISHTANDILTSLTGNYSDQVGQPVANSFRYFDSAGNTHSASSFQYWTDPVAIGHPSTDDSTYNLIDAAGKNTPAPWVPYTRDGCDVGAFSTADIELENTSSDIQTVFTNNGNPGPAAEASSNPAKAVADFEGISVHCAAGSTLCSSNNGGEPDALPQEPGGYSGFNGLFGAKYVNPVLCGILPSACSTENGSPAVNDLFGNPVDDGNGNPGFPGFDPTAAQTLGYVAAMQESGIPITYAYIADAHDNHITGSGTFGPGEAGYVQQLASYDAAFADFFNNLAAHGITKSNALFVVTSDENDHFVGGTPTPSNCDGVTTACVYSHVLCNGVTTACPSNNVGEFNANLAGLLATQQMITTPFTVHSDSAPTFYITGNPAQTAPVTRALERGTGALTVPNPLNPTAQPRPLTQFLADQTEMKLLHMVTADPLRTPTFTLFANPDYFNFAGAKNCNSPCVDQEPGFAWNHGDVQSDIVTTWLGMVGPGVQHLGADGSVWSDHTDIRPTMLALLGLTDDYAHDGRVLSEVLNPNVLPQALHAHHETWLRLAQVYKQLNAPVGTFGLATLAASTTALESNSNGDQQYNNLESALASLGAQRDALAHQIASELEGSVFNGQSLNEQQAKAQIVQAQKLIAQAQQLAG
jgi:hypothetical protein